MSYAAYLRKHVPDFILCAFAALGLGLNVVQGFHIPDATAENVLLVAAATAIPMAALLFAGYNRLSLAVGIPLIVLGTVVYALVLSLFTNTAVFAETYDNDVLVFVVLLPVSFAVYLLARTRAGTAVLFVAGCLTCAAIQFLYGKDLVAATLTFMVSCCALFLLKGALEPRENEDGLFGGDSEKGEGASDTASDASAPAPKLSSVQARTGTGITAQLPRIVMSLGLACTAALAAAAVFLLVIAPLNPPAHELKLITERYSLEEVHVSGVLSFLHQRNENLSSTTADDETRYTNQTNNEQQDAEGETDEQSRNDEDDTGQGSFSMVTLGDPIAAIRYFQEHWWIGLIALALVFLIWALIVAARRIARKRRLGRWKALGPRGEYKALFGHICQVLVRSRLIDIGSKTPLELAEASSETARRLESSYTPNHTAKSLDALAPESEYSTTFAKLAASFAKVIYGLEEPSRADLADAEEYAKLLPKRLSRTIGRFRYLRHFFRT